MDQIVTVVAIIKDPMVQKINFVLFLDKGMKLATLTTNGFSWKNNWQARNLIVFDVIDNDSLVIFLFTL